MCQFGDSEARRKKAARQGGRKQSGYEWPFGQKIGAFGAIRPHMRLNLARPAS